MFVWCNGASLKKFKMNENMGLIIRPHLHRNSEGGVGKELFWCFVPPGLLQLTAVYDISDGLQHSVYSQYGTPLHVWSRALEGSPMHGDRDAHRPTAPVTLAAGETCA